MDEQWTEETGDNESDSVNLRDYLKVLRRRWRWLIPGVLVAVVAAAVVTFLTTPQYASTIRLFVSTPETNTTAAYQGGLFSEQRAASYADLLTGPEVAERVVHALGLHESPSALQKHVTASVVPNTVILSVTVTDPSPGRAERIAKAYADQFKTFVEQIEAPSKKSGSPITTSVLGTPDTTSSPVSPQPVRNLGLAAVLGLLLGIGAAALRESLDTSVRQAEELAALAAAPVLGSVGFDPNVDKRYTIASAGRSAPRVEQFRVLRTSLTFVDVDQPSKVFVITSAVEGDGKTTTASDLAISLAQSGKHVLLVDGDLRRPKVASTLGLEQAVGLTTVLIGQAALSDAIQEWGDAGLAVLASGGLPPDPVQLFQSRAMSDVLRDLRRAFDVVLIDAPPLLPVADATILASQADGALMVVRYGRTTREQVRAGVERLTSVHGRLTGTILNWCPRSEASMTYTYHPDAVPDSTLVQPGAAGPPSNGGAAPHANDAAHTNGAARYNQGAVEPAGTYEGRRRANRLS
ncbi:receptor protein-tyrosine kinase/non-specific protein-tyrosine kinase [Actinopolymorpha cephalotaxi]|uniref:Capsular exopolysaccharide synthesis family protein n=2 Tax=Actinopolymorpha cephalotaxi TaxID=504797 RepID=A0A1I2LBW7_9ACTN|nr:polysaccharide biosynthesis tyrosine autokinase [Actinopolymorpha cephalotaxi]NYH84964.1 capsular exopolysaccharide synthesis family protein [Actinopolymorpha cephalotaxi]SFF76774.1 receptor protein-tyrosine kinase/non-specific protein-tyrosine kinase [Actinopolymorpha cephalotaxi]